MFFLYESPASTLKGSLSLDLDLNLGTLLKEDCRGMLGWTFLLAPLSLPPSLSLNLEILMDLYML